MFNGSSFFSRYLLNTQQQIYCVLSEKAKKKIFFWRKKWEIIYPHKTKMKVATKMKWNELSGWWKNEEKRNFVQKVKEKKKSK